MGAMAFRYLLRRVPMLSQLRRVLPMMHDRLHTFAILGHSFRRRSTVVEVVADSIPREDFRSNEAGTNLSAVIAQDEFVAARFRRGGPIFLRWNEDRFARGPGRATENKRVNALAIDHLDIRHLPRLLFHNDGAEGTTRERQGEE